MTGHDGDDSRQHGAPRFGLFYSNEQERKEKTCSRDLAVWFSSLEAERFHSRVAPLESLVWFEVNVNKRRQPQLGMSEEELTGHRPAVSRPLGRLRQT